MINFRFGRSAFLALASLAVSFITIDTAAAQRGPNPVFKLCTGRMDLNYFAAGQHMKKATTSVTIEVIPTEGSLDNLEKVTTGVCDGAFAQSDALLVFGSKNAASISAIERAGILYREQVNLLCNRGANLGRVVDLNKSHVVAIGPDGSGGRTTWEAFVLADKKLYGPVRTDARSGARALAAVSDGSEVQCMLVVAAMGAGFLKNDAQAQSDRVVMVGTDDRDMTKNAKDSRGKPVYEYGEIPSGTYPRIQPAGTLWGSKAIPTISLDALFVANTNWINANPAAYDRVLKGFAAAKPAIEDMIKPKS